MPFFRIYGSVIKKNNQFFFYLPDIPLEVELGDSFDTYEEKTKEAFATFLKNNPEYTGVFTTSPIVMLIKKTKTYLLNQGYSVDSFIDYKSITLLI